MRRPILTVEDNPDDLELLKIALEMRRSSTPVVAVTDGQQALDYLRRDGQFASRMGNDPEFVLMDIKMPKLNGLDVLKEIRAAASLRHIPVVLFTSSRESVDVERAYQLGVNGYVVKKTDFAQFADDLARIVSMFGWHNETPPEFRAR